MSPLPSPSSPTSPSVTSPASPESGHPLKLQAARSLPPPIITAPLPSILCRPSVIQYRTPITPAAVVSAHARNDSLATFPSSVEILMSPPISTTLTMNYNIFSHSPKHEDGRQSRMDMRSPILEQVLCLPLRLNTNSTQLVFPVEDGSLMSDQVKSKSNWSPSHTRCPAISRSRTRSPIRKRSQKPSQSQCHSHSRSRSRSKSSSHTQTHTRIRTRHFSPPPKYHVNVQASTSTKSFISTFSHLRTPLVPLISVTSGLSHPEFPRSLLQYHLLTHAQLDSLACWYHQVEPAVEETWQYPTRIPAWTGIRSAEKSTTSPRTTKTMTSATTVELETKRRRWGRFIGLRGCESPTTNLATDGEADGEQDNEKEEEEDLVHRMEREWRNAMRRAEDEEMLREKGRRGRW